MVLWLNVVDSAQAVELKCKCVRTEAGRPQWGTAAAVAACRPATGANVSVGLAASAPPRTSTTCKHGNCCHEEERPRPDTACTKELQQAETCSRFGCYPSCCGCVKAELCMGVALYLQEGCAVLPHLARPSGACSLRWRQRLQSATGTPRHPQSLQGMGRGAFDKSFPAVWSEGCRLDMQDQSVPPNQ